MGVGGSTCGKQAMCHIQIFKYSSAGVRDLALPPPRCGVCLQAMAYIQPHHRPASSSHTTVLLHPATPPSCYIQPHHRPATSSHTTVLLHPAAPPSCYIQPHHHPATSCYIQPHHRPATSSHTTVLLRQGFQQPLGPQPAVPPAATATTAACLSYAPTGSSLRQGQSVCRMRGHYLRRSECAPHEGALVEKVRVCAA